MELTFIWPGCEPGYVPWFPTVLNPLLCIPWLPWPGTEVADGDHQIGHRVIDGDQFTLLLHVAGDLQHFILDRIPQVQGLQQQVQARSSAGCRRH